MITVDLQGMMPQSLLAVLGPEFVTTVLDDVATVARAKWIKLAREQLRSSKQDYIRGIQAIEGEGNTRYITLLGMVPNMIEQGVEPFDLRTTLLGPGKGHESASGHRYRAIPFRHGSAGSQGEAGTPMGARYGPQGPQSRAWAAEGHMDKGQAAKMGQSIYRQAKRLQGRSRLPGSTSYSLDGRARGKSMIQVPKLASWHSTDIYAGMQRDRKTYQAATQSKYMTFRTISEANPNGWIHPGITGRMLHQEVERQIGDLLGKTVQVAINRALRGRGA